MKSLKIILIVIAILAGFVLLIGGIVVTTHNSVISMEEQINGAKSNIQVQEKKRFDLIGNLVDTVQSFTKHEDIYVRIAEARASLSDGDPDKALALVNAVSEQYPQLESSGLYKELMTALSATEQSIANYRENYNVQMRNYEKKVRSFPARFILRMLDYEQIDTAYMEFEGLQDAPKGLFEDK